MKPALLSGQIVGGSQLGSAALGGLLTMALSGKLTWAEDGFTVIVLAAVAGVSYAMTYRGLKDENVHTGIERFDGPREP